MYTPVLVRGFCCTLQQRPSSGGATARVTHQSRGGGGGTLRQVGRAGWRLETREGPGSRTRTWTRSKPGPAWDGGGWAELQDQRGAGRETSETPRTPCNDMRQADDGRQAAGKVSKLHLYLPSLPHEEEEQEAETEGTRPSAEETSIQEPTKLSSKPRISVTPASNHTGAQDPAETHHIQDASLYCRPESPSDDVTQRDPED
ncbi:uncharacterized protein LOC115365899 [Myripristis murdjan]|uniref:uncharacterized protein LOC115365899 n=1 Tax=Myripristis murdjan TaxID=586833 RepID=UPI0011762112|nr:uncharacterized protein LOC115365899 [Myripristis murdjan]